MICENTQSVLNNFVSNFFGAVEKFEPLPGVVQWQLPCDLDIGLSTNPRGFDEGTACYFLRLFEARIQELIGEMGDPGAPGVDGCSGYGITIRTFLQPSTSAPFSLRCNLCPSFVAGSIVYIDRSGWYEILAVNATNGALTLSFIQPMLGVQPGTLIQVGRLVIPTGPKGQDLIGPTGATGDTGDKGATGETGDQGPDGQDGETLIHGPTGVNGYFTGIGATGWETNAYALTSAASQVIFGTSIKKPVEISLISAGKYLFRIVSIFKSKSDSAVCYTGLANITDPAKNTSPDPGGTYKFLPGSYTDSIAGDCASGTTNPLTASCIVETTSNYNKLQWQAFGKGGELQARYTILTWVRIT